MAPKKVTRSRPLALAYIRVSTEDQADSGASLEAQRTALTLEAERKGWDVEVVEDAGLSGKSMNRPGLTSALERLEAGQADWLMATKLDRLSRSVGDFDTIAKRARLGERGQLFGLHILDMPYDLTTANGEFMANIMISTARFERRLNGDRTRTGMAQRKAEGKHVGRKRQLPAEVVERITAARAAGLSMAKIADALNADAVPTAQGGAKWHPSTIKAVLASVEREALEGFTA
ncbi:recombinase family protein [Arthrobacter sp. NPDC092385]|uniref:recombinase family protein n=1 Tax=Arthrobacter sp. NPDC092385 TaxID=3363943 RepID=UPI0038099362